MFIYTWKVYSKEQIPRGNFDISQILELIEGHFHMVFGNKTINQRMNPFQYRVEINQNVNLAIACYAERSIFKLLGFGSQSNVIENLQKRALEYMVLNVNMYVQAKLPPSIQRISNMYVYSNIVELSPMDNSKVPIMGFLPIKSNFQEISHWLFYPLLYVRKREQNIKTITMKSSTETSE